MMTIQFCQTCMGSSELLSFALIFLLYQTKMLISYSLCGLPQLSEIVNQGKLVSDEIIFNLLSKRLEAGQAGGESGFILDGFPRTVKQAVSSSFP